MKRTIFLIIFSILVHGCKAQTKEINAKDFGLTESSDATPAIINALKACKEGGVKILVIPTGIYHFYPDFGIEQYCFVSNNDEGLKRIIFPLFDFHDFTINGQGSKFIFHGFANPFVVLNSTNINLKNFSIDVDRPFHSEGIILANEPDGVVLRIPEKFPYQILNGILIFTEGENNKQNYKYTNLLEFDAQKRETAFMVTDHYFQTTEALPAKDLGDRKVKIYYPTLKGTVGNIFVFGPSNRNYPGFAVSDCKDVTFHNITIYHSGGMGIIAQRTQNVIVDSCKVTPSNGRIISSTADATHFVNCSGKILISNNLFENQLDDGINIHGIYVQIVKKSANDELVIELKHIQQYGFDFLKPSVNVEFVKGANMITYSKNTIRSVERINKQFTCVKFEKPLDESVKVGDVIAEIRDYPKVFITNNILKNNRARGVLLNCRGKTEVKNNYFHTPGAAILFEGDACYWFEQGGVSDCSIMNNIFDNCMFGVWGKAIIDVSSGIRSDFEISRYHKNIVIKNNTFRVFDDISLLHGYCIDGLSWKSNKVERTKAYSNRQLSNKKIDLSNCDHVKVDEIQAEN